MRLTGASGTCSRARRREIPEDMHKKHGFSTLGGPDRATKQMIFGINAARLYGLRLKAAENTPMPTYSADRLAKLKVEYELAAKDPRICITAASERADECAKRARDASAPADCSAAGSGQPNIVG